MLLICNGRIHKNKKCKKSIFSSERESKIFFFLIMNSKSLKYIATLGGCFDQFFRNFLSFQNG